MSYSGMWFLVPAPAAAVERHGPRLRALLDEHAADPGNAALRRRWEHGGGLSTDELEWLVSGPLGTDPNMLYEAWNDCGKEIGPAVCVSARNRYPVLGLAHALGPERMAGLPGWFGDMVLTPEEVRASLPAVEAVFDLDEAARAAAKERAYAVLGDSDDVPGLFDAVVPFWRAAVEAGRGVIGAQLIP
ncbi:MULTISPECIES: hypothetical protein [Kitasatospora]|uniref:DUF1877 domain-containing protein n=1 Tax=Kitasatospora cathayae TaxID=3004092 RepID=A0ABY7Q1W1_9ACTN|nr:hypothetical protein [Kitasatospora sp. HUAS 3-15]WBP86621.1 hypothetical protein O1G21_12725 [Kitasatospora sp. HUAS 3-15]